MPRMFANGKVEPDYFCADCCYVKVGYHGAACEGCKNIRRVSAETREKVIRNTAAWAIASAAVLVAVILGCLVLGGIPLGY